MIYIKKILINLMQVTNLQAGWFAHPIYSKSGDYPPIMRTIIDQNSKDENLQWSRLPSFTKEEIKLIRGMLNSK